jgi:3-methyladenine DNA glycosylase/8-oxoguanine DNA glycosylase
MPFTDDALERVVDLIGRVGRTTLAPWGGAEACLDAYEAALRAVVDAQLHTARATPVEPLRSALASTAHLTRDLGAAHLSSVRWILDV